MGTNLIDNFRNKISVFFESRTTFYLLVILNLLFSCIVFYLYRDLTSGDETHYMNYAMGIAHGRYSYWWFLPQYIPDTLRNPGYPLFIYFIISIWKNIYFIKIIQLILYFVSVGLLIKLAEKYSQGYKLKNLFLLILLPSIQAAVITATIQPESLMVFLITSWVYLALTMKDKLIKYILLGLLSGLIFQVRPVFIFIPFIFSMIDTAISKHAVIINNLIMITIYIATMLPYALWNYNNHHMFSITPLESGAGVMHAGYWAFLLPGYMETRYWKNIMANEIIPLTDAANIPQNIQAYNKEWDYIDSSCAHLLTKQDSVNLEGMSKYPSLFKTYSAQYTIAREKLIKKITFNHLTENLFFTFKIKTYTFFRLWISNFKPTSYFNRTIKDNIGALYSFIVSSLIFILSVIFIPMSFIKKKLKLKDFLLFITLIIYFGLIHLPFSIQARYTLPVRMLLFFMLAAAMLSLTEKNTKTKLN